MSRQGMDADTAETVAGVVRLLRRAAELVWAAVDAEGAGSPRQVLGLGIDLAAVRRGTSFRTRFRSMRRSRSGMNRPVSCGLLSSCCDGWPLREPGSGCMACVCRWPIWCGRRAPVSAADHRMVGELLADSDELARDTLLDATPDQALAMVRSWSQLVGSAAEL
jgi:hypothetical protein